MMKKWYGGTLIAALALLLFLPLVFFRTANQPSPAAPAGDDAYPSWPKAARLLSRLPGLPDLYSNFTPDGSRLTLAWRRMRPLLLRSDALPDTGKGVREAAAAWRDLARDLESPDPEPRPEAAAADCPRFVVGAGRRAEVPCGLAWDSAVTLVGVPGGGGNGSGEFWIDLVGEGREARAVVLRYLVRLGAGPEAGDQVLQNSWTVARGWGEAERCPADGLKRHHRVDGLIICNEQILRSMVNHSDASQTNNVELFNKSASYVDYAFPFVRGQTFTATLWSGIEGFHMTVNGKHWTSFGYREGLDPWLVNEVRVAGNVELLSLIINGLPFAENMDIIAKSENLKAPLPKKGLFLLIGVFSTANNFERRMALRRTWMQYPAIRNGDVAVRFFTGLHTSNIVNKQLWREALVYDDIQLMPFVDYYSLISLKTVAIGIFGTEVLPAKYIMKTDDDAFVRVDKIYSILKGTFSNGLLYGLVTFESAPHRDLESKWHISEEEWPHQSYPPWAHGPGYIISRDIATFIVEGHRTRTLQLFKLEDVAMGIWIHEFRKTGRKVHYVNDDRFHSSNCEDGYILAHYQGPRLILCLWKKLQKEQEPVCCE